nr:type II secretion system protein [uncultured Desulfobacter sp.]
MNSPKSTYHPLFNTKGFTLLELLMVITILSAVAWMAVGTIENKTDQVRFDDTRNRLSAIRRAIIGDTSRTLNGMPEIRGYVADMGSLPRDLNALIKKDYCSDPQYTNEDDCTTASETWYIQGRPPCSKSGTNEHVEEGCDDLGGSWNTDQGYERCSDDVYTTQTTCESDGEIWLDGNRYYDSEHNLWAGWNGPYLNAAELTGYSKFRDGWGNIYDADNGLVNGDEATKVSDDIDITDPNNFGWSFILSTNTAYGDYGNLVIRTVGRDGTADDSDSEYDAYDGDYPPQTASGTIPEEKYRILLTDSNSTSRYDAIGGLTVDFGTPDSDTSITGICMKIAYKTKGVITVMPSSGVYNSSGTNKKYYDKTGSWNGTTNQTAVFLFEDSIAEDYDEDQYLPMGQVAYKIFEVDTSGTCSTDTYPSPFCSNSSYTTESDCTTAGYIWHDERDWKTFSLVPGSTIQTLKWHVE